MDAKVMSGKALGNFLSSVQLDDYFVTIYRHYFIHFE